MSKGTKARAKAKRPDLDRELDEALAQTFPASDPVAVGHPTATEPPTQPVDRKAPAFERGGGRSAQNRRLTKLQP